MSEHGLVNLRQATIGASKLLTTLSTLLLTDADLQSTLGLPEKVHAEFNVWAADKALLEPTCIQRDPPALQFVSRRLGPPRHAEVVGVLLELIHAETCGRNAPSPALRTAAWRDKLFLAVRVMDPVPIVGGGLSVVR